MSRVDRLKHLAKEPTRFEGPQTLTRPNIPPGSLVDAWLKATLFLPQDFAVINLEVGRRVSLLATQGEIDWSVVGRPELSESQIERVRQVQSKAHGAFGIKTDISSDKLNDLWSRTMQLVSYTNTSLVDWARSEGWKPAAGYVMAHAIDWIADFYEDSRSVPYVEALQRLYSSGLSAVYTPDGRATALTWKSSFSDGPPEDENMSYFFGLPNRPPIYDFLNQALLEEVASIEREAGKKVPRHLLGHLGSFDFQLADQEN